MPENTLILFKTIFDQSPVSTQIFTLDGETFLVNKSWETLWNVKFSELKFYNILKDTQLVESGVMPYIKRGFKGETVTIPATRYAVPYRWLSARMYPIKNENGKIEFIVIQHEDITEVLDAEKEKHTFVSIIESSDDAIISKTLDGIIHSWNKSAESLFGYKAEEIIGKHITTIIPPSLRHEETEIISKLKRGIRIHHYQTVRLGKYKNLIPVSLSISPVKDRNGHIIGASKIARDITKQKNAERALRENEERLRLALDAGKIGVWDWNVEHNTLIWTDNVYLIHGVTKKFKVTVENFIDLIHPEDKQKVGQAIDKTLKKGVKFNIDFRIVTPKKQVRWVTTRAIVLYNDNDQPSRLLGATSDITERKQMEQDKSDFLSMASHELKTPITSMKMFVELLHKSLSDKKLEKPLYLASRIKDQTNKLKELVNNLLDVSRVETGKLQLNKESFDIVTLVQETTEGLQGSMKNKIVIKNQDPIFVLADKYRMYQVLVNLITNASKYSAADQEIIVSIFKKGQTAVVSVQDFGIGISHDNHEKIFDRLYQVADPAEKTFPGLGLGLFISKEIVKRHKGKIWVESKKGEGSTFSFSLPLHKK